MVQNLNDLLVVTGDLGGAIMGLQILEREHAVYLANPNMQPEMKATITFRNVN
jgi:thiamine-monophosphate kinase